jgi:hypothetical protein
MYLHFTSGTISLPASAPPCTAVIYYRNSCGYCKLGAHSGMYRHRRKTIPVQVCRYCILHAYDLILFTVVVISFLDLSDATGNEFRCGKFLSANKHFFEPTGPVALQPGFHIFYLLQNNKKQQII